MFFSLCIYYCLKGKDGSIGARIPILGRQLDESE